MNEPFAVSAHGLTRRFGSRIAVDHVDLAVRPGELLALLGPNGAGKTTTVRILACLLRPDAGRCSVAGLDVVMQPDEVRRRVGLMTDVPGLYVDMRLRPYLHWFARLYGRPPAQAAARAEELIEQFGLREWAGAPLGALSRGTQQKVALARCLVHDPEVLLLDEPTASLDVEATVALRGLFASLKEAGRALVLCTHNLAEAERVADTVAILIGGRIVHAQTLNDARAPRTFSLLLASPDHLDASAISAMAGIEPQSVRIEGERTLVFATKDPAQTNPELLASLVQRGYRVVQLAERGRSLESIYLYHLQTSGHAHD